MTEIEDIFAAIFSGSPSWRITLNQLSRYENYDFYQNQNGVTYLTIPIRFLGDKNDIDVIARKDEIVLNIPAIQKEITIPLLYEVNPNSLSYTMKNGVLDISLEVMR